MSPILRLARLILADPERARSEAQRISEQAQAKRRRVLAKSRPRRKAEAKDGLVVDACHWALVARVMERANGECELGNHPSDSLEPHHLLSGSNRLRNERVWNVMAACREHHDAFHMNPRRFVCRVRIWCNDNHYPVPNRKEYR